MKTISINTKISELIKENSGSVDAIASIAKPLEKLKNPILRKIMASRVTIAEASKMTGTNIDDFKRVLSPLGFIFEGEESTKEERAAKSKPSWLHNASKEIIDFYDVRPIIDNGADPLKEILQLMKKEKWTFPADIELEYPIPPGSSAVAEVAKCVRFCREALA